MSSDLTSPTRLANFNLFQTAYKTVNNHGIRADLIVPESQFTGRRPVIIRFHGGGLITGDSLSLDWFPQWLLDLAKRHEAIIASANYRLLPEATTPEILSDVEDFWTWLLSPTAAEFLASQETPTSLDLTRIITAGESAGGLLSVCLALSHPTEIRAATASYPNVNMGSDEFNTAGPELVPGLPITESFVRDYIAQMKPGTVVSGAHLPNRLDLMIAAIQYGDFYGLYERGTEGEPRHVRYPMEALDRPDVRVPRGGIHFLQESEDHIVSAAGLEEFVVKARNVLKGKLGGDRIGFTVREGGGHGFDIGVGLEEEWLSEHLRVALEAWLE